MTGQRQQRVAVAASSWVSGVTVRGIATAVLLLVMGPTRGEAAPDYQVAGESFARGEVAVARGLYEGLVVAGIDHPDLFYNLGTACLAVGDLGCAVYRLEQARRREPRADDIRRNLAVARARIAERLPDRLESAERPDLGTRLLAWVSIDQVAAGFLAAEFAVCIFSGVWLWRRRRRFHRALGGATLTGLLVVVVMGACLWMVRRDADVVVRGVVLAERSQLRASADPLSEVRAPVHAGLIVRVRDREGAWFRVQLGNGGQGWLPRQDVGILD